MLVHPAHITLLMVAGTGIPVDGLQVGEWLSMVHGNRKVGI
jgi:hypothetical protein